MFIGYDINGAIVWRGEELPRSEDGLCAIPEGVYEIEDSETGIRLVQPPGQGGTP